VLRFGEVFPLFRDLCESAMRIELLKANLAVVRPTLLSVSLLETKTTNDTRPTLCGEREER